jgi:hypothetical protein
MEEEERQGVAAEMIAFELERLKRQASANGLDLLADLIELAIVEARENTPKR